MTKLLLMLMMVGLWSGCGDSPTRPDKDDPLIGIWRGKDGRQTITLSFYSDGRFKMDLISGGHIQSAETWRRSGGVELIWEITDSTLDGVPSRTGSLTIPFPLNAGHTPAKRRI